jgi:hypothetical protein
MHVFIWSSSMLQMVADCRASDGHTAAVDGCSQPQKCQIGQADNSFRAAGGAFMLASPKKPSSRSAARSMTSAAVVAAALLTGAESGRADTYTVLIRQMDGVESIPAHMACEDGKVCLGEMSVSVAGAHRRVFVRAMIYSPYAYFKFRSDARVLQCGSSEFITFQVGPAPLSAHWQTGICDPPSSAQNDASGLRHPVLTNFPPFAILRIDVTSREADRR